MSSESVQSSEFVRVSIVWRLSSNSSSFFDPRSIMPLSRTSVASVCSWYLRLLSLSAQRRAVVSDPSPPCVVPRLVPWPVHSTHLSTACSTSAAGWAATTPPKVVSDLLAGTVASGASPLDALSPSGRPDSPSEAPVPANPCVCQQLLPAPASLPHGSPSPSFSVAPGMRLVFRTLPPRRPPPWPDPPPSPCAVSMLLPQAHFIMKWPCSTHWLPPPDNPLAGPHLPDTQRLLVVWAFDRAASGPHPPPPACTVQSPKWLLGAHFQLKWPSSAHFNFPQLPTAPDDSLPGTVRLLAVRPVDRAASGDFSWPTARTRLAVVRLHAGGVRRLGCLASMSVGLVVGELDPSRILLPILILLSTYLMRRPLTSCYRVSKYFRKVRGEPRYWKPQALQTLPRGAPIGLRVTSKTHGAHALAWHLPPSKGKHTSRVK